MADAWKEAARYFAQSSEPGVGERMKSAWEEVSSRSLGPWEPAHPQGEPVAGAQAVGSIPGGPAGAPAHRGRRSAGNGLVNRGQALTAAEHAQRRAEGAPRPRLNRAQAAASGWLIARFEARP